MSKIRVARLPFSVGSICQVRRQCRFSPFPFTAQLSLSAVWVLLRWRPSWCPIFLAGPHMWARPQGSVFVLLWWARGPCVLPHHTCPVRGLQPAPGHLPLEFTLSWDPFLGQHSGQRAGPSCLQPGAGSPPAFLIRFSGLGALSVAFRRENNCGCLSSHLLS